MSRSRGFLSTNEKEEKMHWMIISFIDLDIGKIILPFSFDPCLTMKNICNRLMLLDSSDPVVSSIGMPTIEVLSYCLMFYDMHQ